MMTERMLNDLLASLCTGVEHAEDQISDFDYEDMLVGCEADHFRSAGLMTNDEGFVLRLSDGSEFQVTVRRSR